jgi:hypothetical protein
MLLEYKAQQSAKYQVLTKSSPESSSLVS